MNEITASTPAPKSSPLSTQEAHPPHDYFGGLLSYMIPGLGQITQGRVAKGLLFFLAIHGLFFYGMWLGEWKNVWLPTTGARNQNAIGRLGDDLYERLYFVGQFWIGVSAWPAVYQYVKYDPDEVGRDKILNDFQRTPPHEELNRIQREKGKLADLGLIYTLIAGVLNVLVIYDAVAGPAQRAPKQQPIPLPTT